MDSLTIVSTHHKTGTVWMRAVFQGIAKSLGIPFVVMNGLSGRELRAITAPTILFNNHSDFRRSEWMLNDERVHMMHMIRDPRDVVISAMHYHKTANERWLLKPQRPFYGHSYQQVLNELPNDTSRYIFEMNNSVGRVISDMREWNYSAPNCCECRYEDLVGDRTMVMFAKAVARLGFRDEQVPACCDQFWKKSLFGKLEEKGVEAVKSAHVRSGKCRQWSEVFDRDLATAFVAKFGNVLIELGYEVDNTWVDSLPPSVNHGPAEPQLREIEEMPVRNAPFL